jgi:hypothetical protein
VGRGRILRTRRAAEAAPATSILGIGTADEPGERRGVVGVTGEMGEVHPEQIIQFARQLQRLELDRDEPVARGIELVVLVDLPLHPPRLQRGLRADDDREAAVLVPVSYCISSCRRRTALSRPRAVCVPR